jgi:hypothetical protein
MPMPMSKIANPATTMKGYQGIVPMEKRFVGLPSLPLHSPGVVRIRADSELGPFLHLL